MLLTTSRRGALRRRAHSISTSSWFSGQLISTIAKHRCRARVVIYWNNAFVLFEMYYNINLKNGHLKKALLEPLEWGLFLHQVDQIYTK